ncbi:MAG TPA: right-handed parallel beta-helix repeat-containing protein [Prolixibacteraceae bacterium]|jgi:hypothetical protein
MKKRLSLFAVSLMLILGSCTLQSKTSNYYFDAENGNDINSGTSPENAFKSLNKIQDLTVRAGDSILLKSGDVFIEKLFFTGKGEMGFPVVIGKYGGVARPHIKGNATQNEMVHIYNSQNIIIRDLEISNSGNESVFGLRGLKVEVKNYGDAHHTTIDNLFIHDVNGGLEINKGGGGAIYLQNSRDEDTIPSRFINLLVENCIINDCQRDGIRMGGQWIRSKWYPNKGVIIRNNVIDGIPGDGIVVVGCDSALVEYNTVRNFPETLPPSEACDGIWPWSSDNTIVQFNVVSDHHSIVDGYAYDSDWNCRNSIFQYNLSYNNIGGFILVIGTNGWPESWCVNGNSDTQIRYNISINDGLRNYQTEGKFFSPVVHLTGLTKNTNIDKNIFYFYPKPDPKIDRTVLHFSNHDAKYGEGDIFRNNFIYASEPTILAKEEGSVNNHYSANLFIGPLNIPSTGFSQYDGKFNQMMWYDTNDKNWDRLIEFVKDKTVPVNGKDIPVMEIIGFNQ